MVYTVPHFIAGKTYTETTTKIHEIHNPAFGETIGQVNFASTATCDHEKIRYVDAINVHQP